MTEQISYIPARLKNAAVNGHVAGAEDIIDDVLNRTQNDINEEVAAVPYNATTPNGMGKVVLKKNDNFKQVVEAQTNGNTIFVIKYDFTLTGNVTVPANCVLEFDGGSISGAYIITGNDTNIKANEKDVIFTAVSFAGTWNITNIYATWFSDIEQTNRLKQVFALSDDSVHNNIFIPSGLTCSLIPLSNTQNIGCIELKSNTALYLDGTLSLESNSFDKYEILLCFNKHNIEIIGNGKIVGDKDTHTYEGESTHEWGYGISLKSCYNISIKGIEIYGCTGDGLYINKPLRDVDTVNNYNVSNIIIHDCRRNGITIESANNINISDFRIYNINGIAPKSGICLEPTIDSCVDINIKNGEIYDCTYGIIGHCTNVSSIKNININNVYIHGNTTNNIRIVKTIKIVFQNCRFEGKGDAVEPSSSPDEGKDSNIYVRNDSSATFVNCVFNTGVSSTLFCSLVKNCIIANVISCYDNVSILDNIVVGLIYIYGKVSIKQNTFYHPNGNSYSINCSTDGNLDAVGNIIYTNAGFVYQGGSSIFCVLMNNICYSNNSNPNIGFVQYTKKANITANNVYTNNTFNIQGSSTTDVEQNNIQKAIADIDVSIPTYITDIINN